MCLHILRIGTMLAHPSSVSYVLRENNDDYCILAYIPNILPESLVHELTQEFESLEFYQGTMESGSPIHREQIWFQNEGHYFCRTWKNRFPRWEAHDYTAGVTRVQQYLQADIVPQLTQMHASVRPIEMNSCLLNWYRDGTQFIPPHRDSAVSFGENPTILGVSIGAERTLRLTRRSGAHQEYNIRLANNSLFMMAGATQRYYFHEIPAEPSCTQERWSLTFREYLA